MNEFGKYAMLLGLTVLSFLYAFYYRKISEKREKDNTRLLARAGIFGALSAVLYIVPVFQIKLPFLPAFMEIHFDEVPSFIAGFAYGPFVAAASLLVKTILKLPFSSTLTVGEWADLLFSLSFVLPSSFIYQKKRNLRGVAIGFAVSTLLQLFVSSLFNVYVFLPFYMNVMGLSYEQILSLCQLANKNVTSLGWPYLLFCVLPLNLIKNACVIVITFFVYRHLHTYLPREDKEKKPS